jgi:hypothetical protein
MTLEKTDHLAVIKQLENKLRETNDLTESYSNKSASLYLQTIKK